MSNLKIVLAILLTFCMIFSSFSAFAVFVDSDDACVQSLVKKGIIKGYSEKSFGPDDICTRGQFLTFLWRASGEPDAEKCEEIVDVTGDEYYANAVWWAYKNGITKIYSDYTFRADAPTDREHAAYFLYNWAKLYDKSDIAKTMNMNKYLEDGVDISSDSRTAFSWAMATGILSECENSLVKPKDPVSRLWTANAIGALVDNHVCKWSSWHDNGDGTHSRVCEEDAAHKETNEHSWNDGELTIAPTKTKKGLITYTCTGCLATKTEEAAPGTEFVTRADLEEALVATAFSYHTKGTRVQYDSTHLTDLTAYLGGLVRITSESAPEVSTKDNTFYAVCSDFTYLCYYEGLGIKDLGDTTWPFGFSTAYLFSNADNQNQEQILSNKLIEPITDDDVDTSIIRWIDFDAYKEYKGESTISRLMSYGVLENSSFTDYTSGLIFKDDGFEESVHYSYYDTDGNKLDYKEAREKYLDPYVADIEKVFRPGDVLVNHSHAMIYVGNGRLVDCTSAGGGKIDINTGVEKAESNGAIWADELLYDRATNASNKSLIILRPLEFVVKSGYDNEPGNDIVKNLQIPEKTKSRIKYPMMDIDRTVDITHFGTAVKGGNLTYTIEISNRTDMEHYKTWAGENALQDYENLVVTETIPQGCEYVEGSVTNGGKYDKGVITWNIEKIAAGESTELSYTVKVTADEGTVIVNDGGMVDNIPSNTIKNTVGGEKLSEASQDALLKIAQTGDEGLSTFGSDTDFANAIYKNIGAELDLPSVGEITKTLFPIKSHVPGYGMISWIPNHTPINLYENKAISSDVNSILKPMVIDRFWGGRKFYVGDELKWEYADNSIKEFKKDYLEAGDIIIYAATSDKTNLSYEFDTVGVMIYDGKNILSSIKTADGTTYEICSEENIEAYLTKLFMKNKDLFFALRPSQAK